MATEKIAARMTLGVVVVAALALAAPASAHHPTNHSGGPQPSTTPTTAPPTSAEPSESPLTVPEVTPAPLPTIPSFDPDFGCDEPDVPDQYPPHGGALGLIEGEVIGINNVLAETFHDAVCRL